MRRILFRIHQWAGVILALYVAIVGLTGAALVFRPEMQKIAFARYFEVERPNTAGAPVGIVVSRLLEAYPGAQLSGIDYPTARRGTYLSYLVRNGSLDR